jgi:adenylate cyclase
MRLPVRLPEYRLYQKWLAAGIIAIVCAGLGVALWTPVKIFGAVGMLDHVFYDSLYRLRPWESQVDSPIVIVSVDETSLEIMDSDRKVGWPWPRKYWGEVVSYLESEGAKAIVFDILFDKSSVYDKIDNDDQQFGEAIDSVATPVVMAAMAQDEKTIIPPVPPAKNKTLGCVNFEGESIVRTYPPLVFGHDSLALATLKRIGRTPPAWASMPFLLHYYGPHAKDGKPVTFRYMPAVRVIAAFEDAGKEVAVPIPDGFFKNKIVMIATTASATYDLKSSPLDAKYPGTEVHATALLNMLADQRVSPTGTISRLGVMLLGCFISAIGTVIPPRVPLKLVGGVAGLSIVLAITWSLFLGHDIRWMPPASALSAAMLSAFVGLSYSYLTELRQRRFILKALAASVSKEVADEIAKDPKKLGLGGQRRDMSVMFTDLANFTALTESIKDEKLTAVLQFYLEEMSGVVLGINGTVDKYIGDAIMAFWNAPTNQPDHATRACRTALEMRRREAIIQPRLREMSGGVDVYSRIGINSGSMFVGNLGSTFKFSYTVIGDSVNLASRLEGANKMYGTRIMLSESTAAIVKDQFVLRKLDLLRVKGKQQPIAVYELIAERSSDLDPLPYITRYESALALYQQGKFDKAEELLSSLNKDFPDDGPTDTLLGRVLDLRENPPGPDWDGVYVAKDK